MHRIFRGISKVDFETELLPHLTHSNPCLLPFDFIFLLHFLQVGLMSRWFFASCITRKNSTLNILTWFFDAFLIPPPMWILSPEIRFRAILVIFVGLYMAHLIFWSFTWTEKNTWPPCSVTGVVQTSPTKKPEVYGFRSSTFSSFFKWSPVPWFYLKTM